MSSKKVLITGVWGSIGAQITDFFLRSTDWRIVGIDSFRHKGYRDRMDLIDPKLIKRVKTIQTDLVCPVNPAMAKEIGRVDYVLHLAALSDVSFSVDNPAYTIQNNVNSTLTMLEYARRAKPEIFVYFSTDEIYGAVKKGDAHKEWSPHRPSNAYAASKAASEDICHAYWRSYDVPLIITNTMNNFSFAQSPSKFPVMVQKKIERGEEVIVHGNKKEIGTRFYMDSRVAAHALLHIIKLGAKRHAIGEIDEPLRYHIVGEKAYSNLELAELIAKLMGKPLKYKLQDFHKDNPAHDIHYGLQNNILKATGWEHPVSIEESLKEVIAWQQEHPEWM